MQAVKIFLVVMGLLIAAGFVFIGIEVYHRVSRADHSRPLPPSPAVTGPAEIALGLPEGTRLGDPVAAGAWLAVRATLPQGGDRLLVIDPRSNAVTVFIPTASSAPAGPLAAPVH